ncbi:GNAT family N-acetyltransferase [Geminicoccaceae bacterium 1502E]|nr:GNAT family N-acetyltransferase [Geminicoccaceae bacterium 1502E]
MSEIRYERLSGAALERALPALARLRIEVFSDFPYLYEGSQAYEERYLRTYAETAGSVIIGALDGDRLVGAATALPLAAEPEELRRPVAEAGYDVARVFYFGESVLQKAWRGRGIGVAFFREREAWARGQGGFTHACFCGVVRAEDDPRRPAGHVPLDAFWRKRGFEKLEGALGTISWQDRGEPAETAKQMQFWIKRLAGG